MNLLVDRLLLNDPVSEEFKTSVLLRIKFAKSSLDLDDSDFEYIFCNSFNNHTCMIKNGKKLYVIFDEHHFKNFELIYMNYISFTRIKLSKSALDSLEIERFWMNKLWVTLFILKAEHNLINGNISCTLKYIEMIKKNISEFKSDRINEFLYTILIKKGKITEIMCLDFYVFHELVHIKYEINSVFFSKYKIQIESFIKDYQLYEKEKTKKLELNQYPDVEECICDVYSLLLMIEYYKLSTRDENYNAVMQRMFESYIIAVLTLDIIGPLRENVDLISSMVFNKSLHRINICLSLIIDYLEYHYSDIVEIDMLLNVEHLVLNSYYDIVYKRIFKLLDSLLDEEDVDIFNAEKNDSIKEIVKFLTDLVNNANL